MLELLPGRRSHPVILQEKRIHIDALTASRLAMPARRINKLGYSLFAPGTAHGAIDNTRDDRAQVILAFTLLEEGPWQFVGGPVPLGHDFVYFGEKERIELREMTDFCVACSENPLCNPGD
ncbi:MAG TPA: hypothetical protein VM100_04225 [Longimicrobiales bacterium]|nr:hypothetical protein [Longimicrobiales bacterium]